MFSRQFRRDENYDDTLKIVATCKSRIKPLAYIAWDADIVSNCSSPFNLRLVDNNVR